MVFFSDEIASIVTENWSASDGKGLDGARDGQ